MTMAAGKCEGGLKGPAFRGVGRLATPIADRTWSVSRPGPAVLALVLLANGCGGRVLHESWEPLEWEGPFAGQVDYIIGDVKDAPLRYEFRNVSREAVRFVGARPDCKCTSVELPKGEFGPGRSGTIGFRLNLADGPEHVVGSRVYVEYMCGSRAFARVLEFAVNKRRPLESVPEIVELKATPSKGGGRCTGQVTFTRFTKPGRRYEDFQISQAGVQGDIVIGKDEGWGPDEREGGFLKSSRTLHLAAGALAPPSGTARLAIFAGSPPIGKGVLEIRWSQENLVAMEPETLMISKDHPTCKLTITSHNGPPSRIGWEMPEGFAAATGQSDPSKPLEVSVSLKNGAAPAEMPRTEVFNVLVCYGERTVKLTGTIVVLSRP
ncbi:MAG: hypothetical protein ACP5XB_19495 [Isosphaeraceae bacterium]